MTAPVGRHDDAATPVTPGDPTQYTALSFDCYGTLIDWEAGIGSVLAQWARTSGSDLSEEELLVAYSGHEAAVASEYPALAYCEVLQAAMRRTAAALGRHVTDADVQALGRSVPDWPAFADSAEALARLKRNYKLIILSNVHREGFAGSNARLGVEFDAIVTAEDVGSYKPAPRNFDALRDALPQVGVSASQLLHVAQSLFHDHVPAARAGLPCVWINRRHDQPGWGATPDPSLPIEPLAQYPTLSGFADAVDRAFADRDQ